MKSKPDKSTIIFQLTSTFLTTVLTRELKYCILFRRETIFRLMKFSADEYDSRPNYIHYPCYHSTSKWHTFSFWMRILLLRARGKTEPCWKILFYLKCLFGWLGNILRPWQNLYLNLLYIENRYVHKSRFVFNILWCFLIYSKVIEDY